MALKTKDLKYVFKNFGLIVPGRNVLLTGSILRWIQEHFSITRGRGNRLVALKKAWKGLITQRRAAEEIGQIERHVRRRLKRLKGKGDAARVHALLS
jgi:hypothetical protein